MKENRPMAMRHPQQRTKQTNKQTIKQNNKTKQQNKQNNKTNKTRINEGTISGPNSHKNAKTHTFPKREDRWRAKVSREMHTIETPLHFHGFRGLIWAPDNAKCLVPGAWGHGAGEAGRLEPGHVVSALSSPSAFSFAFIPTFSILFAFILTFCICLSFQSTRSGHVLLVCIYIYIYNICNLRIWIYK